MIDIKSLSKLDIGKEVCYSPREGFREYGKISSWNEKYIFVKYNGKDTSAATKPEDLTFSFN